MSIPQLRPYQTEAVAACMAAESGVAVLPTGSGKSLVIAGIVNQCERSVILQPSKEILESNLDKIRAFGFDGASVYSASMGVKEIGRATYATIGSIIKLADQLAGLDALIIDEAHLVNATGGQYLEFIQKTKPKRLIGLTATPYRLHTVADVNSYKVKTGSREFYSDKISDLRLLTRTRPRAFQKIVHVTQCADLLAQGFLHQPEYIVSGKDSGLLKSNSSGAEFDDRSVYRYMKETKITDRIVTAVHDAIEAGLRHILVFVPLLRESDLVVRRLRSELGIVAENIAGDTPKLEREDKLKAFKRGQIRAMVNVGTLTTGYDFPRLDCIIGARPTMSLGLYYQMIGRAVRPHPDKERAAVYDLVDNYSRFGDPLAMRIVCGSTGLYYVLSANGRLTNRDLAAGPEKDDDLGFGQHKHVRLCEVPQDYMEWYMAKGEDISERHRIEAELQRRHYFGGGQA